jgi:hypothetical protein
MATAQAYFKDYADKHCSATPSFHKGELVWLQCTNIAFLRPKGKLDYCYLGPFKVIEPVGPAAYRLSLPHTLKIHNVFHVSLLSKYTPNSIAGHVQPPPPPVVIDDHVELEVESILDSHLCYGCIQYLVDWKG